MTEHINHERRRFVGGAAMAMAAAPLDLFAAAADAQANPPAKTTGELRALGSAVEWLNSPRMTAESLLGKVVLVDFCTYTCINWLRTLPYIRGWAAKYKGAGLVVIGVHTPEFAFEHDLANVRTAIAGMHIDYPIVIDNERAIWRAFSNQYWPALYFLDGRGRVRERQFGEGEYERSERTIQRLLADAGASIQLRSAGVARDLLSPDARGVELPADWGNVRSPENYLGYARTENFASRGGAQPDRRRAYEAPMRLALNQWAIAGDWTMGQEGVVSHAGNGRLTCRFHARDLHLVMGPAARGASVRVRVTLDGQPPGAAHGLDVNEEGLGVVAQQRLYQLIRQPMPIVDRLLQVEFLDAGAEIFAFTFG
jgi:thiol-disulfide isomerase/thioredoxin